MSIINHKRLMTIIKGSTSGFSGKTSVLVRAHMVFMVFFFFAYLGVSACLIADIDVIGNLFTGLIFLFGAIFVYIGIFIQHKSVDMLNDSNAELRKHTDVLETKQEQLIALYEELKRETEQREMAQKSEQLKSDFLSQVSHELRTPLTSIYGFTKLIKKDFDSIVSGANIQETHPKKIDRINNNLEIVSHECSRLTRMVTNVLDLAKIESGQTTWDDKPISLRDVIKSSLTAVEGLIHEKEAVSIECDLPANLPTITADADLMTQVLVNVLSNAIKFSDDGIVMLSAKTDDKSITISVSDEGVGIGPDDINSIFDKYYTARSGNTLGAPRLGTGLGLPICKEIVEHYGGDISVESKSGSGSVFSITLPIESVSS
ncbi:HAMP domain-containing sensor histidine kinase [Pseudodesulfovibrio sp. zrk46]|uniref:sensor histidine kinase n=1 Tax=Pseudodesulfovibrio sp. zrk46 TaxID=2725288 RepID=UPI00144990C7|nr:HAMP domain-containing sensor histidine kinase [Pseudodesulfovibrio sp. zrk46]QJB56406.1 HAMP domain-containing histidine kinase [Pseudodesulfovibrio sp. zrk46]